jgi:probable phosphoglycerate mutase
MTATTLGLVRHGETDWNAEHRIQGGTDIPLNDVGRAQARVTAARLADEAWDGILTSPLVRAAETARIIADVLGLGRPTVLPALRERAFGEIEGLTLEERMARFGEDGPVPGLESRTDVVDRARPALAAVAARHPGRRLLVVTHGGVIGSLMRFVTDFSRPRPHEVIHNGSVNVFRVDDAGRWALTRYDARPGRPGYRPVP